jgi:hypothetical protein
MRTSRVGWARLRRGCTRRLASLVLAILSAPILALGSAHAAAATPAAPEPLRVLFVGNSLTYYNDLPATFAALYRHASTDGAIEVDLLARAGATLREHLDQGALAMQLRDGDYDVVVLQEFGGWPACSSQLASCAATPQALVEAVALVRAHRARPVWFSTWQSAPAVQQALSRQARALADPLSLPVVDVGATMQRVDAQVRPQLLFPDGHPDVAGTWLAAALLLQAQSVPLPDAVPAPACGRDWRGAGLSLDRLATTQAGGRAHCHAPSDAQWRALRAALPAPAAAPAQEDPPK